MLLAVWMGLLCNCKDGLYATMQLSCDYHVFYMLASDFDDGVSSEVDSSEEEDGGEEEEEEEEDGEEKEEEEGGRGGATAAKAKEDEDFNLEGLRPTSEHRKLASRQALKMSLQSGLYPEYLGVEGPYLFSDPRSNSELDFLTMLWPQALCDLIVEETNRYACRKGHSNWVDLTRDELYTFLGVNLAMGIHKMPRIGDVWSKDGLLGIPEVQKHMTRTRFWQIWSNLHVVDDNKVSPSDGLTRKFQPVLDVLSDTFLSHYSPSQELCVDEAMVKYKGRARGRVYMPKKPIKRGFKIWCCCCSCCGYLCTFRVYKGKPTDPMTGKRVAEKGLVLKVVQDLISPFTDLNHVLYCDNFYSSGPLVSWLAQRRIYFAGTIKQNACGFPESLKGVKPPAGSYVVEKVTEKEGDKVVCEACYYVFSDRKVVSLVTNVFPEHMEGKVPRVQRDGFLRYQSVPPVLPAYNKFMGGVDRLSQLRRTYGFDRKSRRYWLRPFFQFFDYAVDNAFILYKHNCAHYGQVPVKLLDFRLGLIRLLLQHSRCRKRLAPRDCGMQEDIKGLCRLVRSVDVNLKRGRCHQCVLKNRDRVKFTSYACSFCKVRLCKITCFAEFHQF